VRLLALHPDPARGPGLATTEVDVEPGTTVAELRPHLARLTGYAGWASTAVRFAVDDALLDETHRAGHHPLVPGATVRHGAGDPPVERAAVRADHHVAVVAGPDSGHLLPLTPGGTLHLAGTTADGVDDPGLGRLTVRCRGRRVHVRSDVPGTLTRARRTVSRGRHGPSRRSAARPLHPGRWRRWREGDHVDVGRTTLVLRRPPASGPGAAGPHDAGDPHGRRRERDPATAALWVGPVVGSVVLAAVVRQPLLLVVGLVTPLVALATHLVGARRRRSGGASGVGGPSGSGGTSGSGDASGPGGATGRGGVTGPPVATGGRGESGPGGTVGPGGAAVVARAVTDPADLVAATMHAILDGGPRVRGGAPWAPDGTLVVVGPPGAARDVARGLLLGELGSHLDARVVLRTADERAWQWCATVAGTGPLPATDETGDPGACVVVCDTADAIGGLARWRAATPAGHRLLLVLPHRGAVPAWCRHVVEVDHRGATLHAPGASSPVPLHAVREHRARAQLVRAHAARAVAADGAPDLAPPGAVDLGDLPHVPRPDAGAVAAAWDARRPGLAAPLGRGPGRAPVTLDLVADGPHALVAGTTGAGKSELLSTLVLGLATAHPPERLAVLLVDFKGGTGLGAVAGLPHVLEHVTDLDTARTHRVLTGLRAEVRRRERILAERGITDLTDLTDVADRRTGEPTPPPRLLVVVDELRALADDVPDAVATLARLAAQGRSLGIHLVLATQRPAGVVSADLRANVGLRIALRVTDEADSRDVVEAVDAARIDARLPGRALVRRGSRPLELVQVARARPGVGTPPARLARAPRRPADAAGAGASAAVVLATASAARAGADVSHRADGGTLRTLAPRDAATTTDPSWPGLHEGALAPRTAVLGDGAACETGWTPAPGRDRSASPAGSDGTATWVAAARQAAQGRPAPSVPWLPDLPDQVAPHDVPPGPGLALALGDVPHEQRREGVRWEPERGHLLVVGGPGSGRTTTLVAVGVQALAAGRPVHAVGLPAAAVAALHAADVHATLGTVAEVHEVRRITRLLGVLAARDEVRTAGGPTVLLVDGLTSVLDALGAVARGAGAERLTACWRGAPLGVAVAASADVSSASAHHAAAFRDRLVLRVADGTLDALAGVPAALAGPRSRPGRAVRLGDGPPLLCQVARVDPDERGASGPASLVVPVAPAEPTRPAHEGVARVERLPVRVDLPATGTTSPVRGRGGHGAAAEALRPFVGAQHPGGHADLLVPVGVGGDAASEVVVGLGRALLVAGPPGSGRTNALGVVAAAARATGTPVVRLVAHDRAAGGLPGVRDVTSAQVPTSHAVVLVDDADELPLLSPETAEVVERLLREPAGTVRVVVAATSTAAAGALRGPLAAAVRHRLALVLDPLDPAGAELVGPAAPWLVDPRERPTGRGVLVAGRARVPVQVYRCGAEPPASPAV